MIIVRPAITLAQQPTVRQQHFNVKENLALQGYDPVSYFTGKPVVGKVSFRVMHKGITYQFANSQHAEAFKASPEKYEPAYGGWCAYAMGESGEKVKVDPETYKIIAGRVYLFYNFWGNNTLEDWNKNEGELKVAADRNWKKFIP